MRLLPRIKRNKIGVADKLELKLVRDGKVIWRWCSGWRNTPTNTGFAEIANLAGNVSSPVAFTYLACGTDATGEEATDTALGAEVTDTGLQRAAAVVSRITTTVTNDTLQLYKDWTATGAKILREIGAFNSATTGIMLGRTTYAAITTANGDHFQATYKFKFSA